MANIKDISYIGDIFYVSGIPTIHNKDFFFNFLKTKNIKHVVRVCFEQPYPDSIFNNNGINIYSYPYADGTTPDKSVIENWLKVCEIAKDNEENILIHCYSGLGRAPLLVAIKFIKSGKNYVETVELIRSKRKGSFNRNQLQYLQNYSKQFTNKCLCILQ